MYTKNAEYKEEEDLNELEAIVDEECLYLINSKNTNNEILETFKNN